MNARDGFRSAIEVMQQSARLMGAFMPGSQLFCDWRELDNKFQAFRLFQYADRELALPFDRYPMEELVERALALDAFRAIWVLEGVGYLKTNGSSLAVEGLLAAGPERAMIPLHAGMGTAFAERLLGGLGPKPSTAEVADVVDRFIDTCRANCRPGWEDACIEPIGLVVRCLYPHLLAPVSAAMGKLSADLRALFWHGVGRSLYFVPTNFMPIPGAQERMAKGAAEETGHLDRRQVLAGLVWAVTLVNLPQPAVIRSFAAICSRMKMQDAFTNGLISALLAWRHMAPGDRRHIGAYGRPLPDHHRDAVLWNTWIEAPARDALENIFPGLERRNQIPALYSFRTAEELLDLSDVSSEARV